MTATKIIPEWLKRHIEATTGAPLGARKASGTRCRRCHARLLTGLDHDLCAGQALVDPFPLTPMGELLALLAGRPTYRLVPAGHGRFELDYRDEWQIANKPPGKFDVLAAHKCNSPPLPATGWTKDAETCTPPMFDEPPF